MVFGRGTTDDPEFILVASRISERPLAEIKPEDLFVVAINNWFDHKWLKFSGIGIVPFEFPEFMNRDEGMLHDFRQPQVTIPPFSPSRVVKQRHLRRCPDGSYAEMSPRTFLHGPTREHSAKNLHRRIERISGSAVFIWYSSNTLANARASVMVYSVNGGNVDTWFAGFRKSRKWEVHLTHGISREQVLEFVSEPATSSPS